jgi:tetratricopeptide (TPR) repeat protein
VVQFFYVWLSSGFTVIISRKMAKKTRVALIIILLLAVGVLAAAAIIYSAHLNRDPIPALEAGERPDWAYEALTKMAFNDPDDLEVQWWLLRLEIEKEDFVRAESRQAMLDMKAPGHYVTESGRCRLEVKKRIWERAAKACERALKKSDRSLPDLHLAASAYLKTGRLQAAFPILGEARLIAPDDLKVLNNLGYYYLRSRQYDQAIDHFRKVLIKKPSSTVARKNLARAYAESGRHRQAVDELKALLVARPDDVDSLYNLTMIYIQNLKDYGKAREYMDLAVAHGLDQKRTSLLGLLIQEAELAGSSTPSQPPGSRSKFGVDR